MSKILIFDLECNNLYADIGHILCMSYKWLGDKSITTIRIRDGKNFIKDKTDDSFIVKQASRLFEEADVVVAHFGTFFDEPYLRTRLLMTNCPSLPPAKLVDPWKTAKKKLRLHSNRLDSIFEAFDIDAKKPKLKLKIWDKAATGDIKALKYVEHRCICDVDALAKVFLKFRPFMLELPNMAVVEGKESACPRCGIDRKMTKRGYYLTKSGKHSRFQCQSCGGWSHARKKESFKSLYV